MALKNTGQCMGGPWAGQWHVHFAENFDVFDPAMEFNLAKAPDDLNVRGAKLGEYHFSPDQNGMWVWHPTNGH